MYKIRDEEPDCEGTRRNDKLPQRPLIGQPGKDHKADAKKHARIVDDKAVSSGIKHAEQNNRRIQNNLLKRIKKQIRSISRFKADHYKAAEMNRKHQYILSCIDTASPALLAKTEDQKAFTGIQGYQQCNYIFGKFADI